MGTRDNKCIEGEIAFENKLNEKRQKDQHKRKMHVKKANSNLNLKLSIFVFLVMSILALVIILNKGKIGNFSLIYIKANDVHTAELEADNYYISIIDAEKVGLTLTIDGVEKTDGFKLYSSDPNIARIENGMVVAGSTPGVATITAHYDEYNMDISTDLLAYLPINTVTATITKSKLEVGEEAQLSIEVIPEEGNVDYMTYTSSDKDVATVDGNGLVTAVSPGEATILIEDELTGCSVTKTVTVKE